jgi:signal transduction histidine kinase
MLAARGDDDEHQLGPEAYAADTPGLFALWIDARGSVVRNTRGVTLPGLPDTSGFRATLSGQEQLVDRTLGDIPVRLLSVPVAREGRVIGAVQVGMSLLSSRQAVAQTVAIFLLTGLVGVILAAFGSVFLANRAMLPIRAAFERQRRFIADASHELRTPVAVLRARAELLVRSGVALPEQQHRELVQMQRDADELTTLLTDLLDLARLDAGNGNLEVEPVALVDVVEEIAAQFSPVAEREQITISASAQPIWARAHLSRLRQVLRAIVDNAIKHTPPGGRVAIEAEAREQWAVVCVADTGTGIPEGELTKVQVPFYRVEPARSRSAGTRGGAGLGLSIATELVRLMRGDLRIDSRPGKGTTVTIRLPLATA